VAKASGAVAAAAAAAPICFDPHEPLWWPGKIDAEMRGFLTEAEDAALHQAWRRSSAGHVSKAALNRDVPPHLRLRVIMRHKKNELYRTTISKTTGKCLV
jgi:hypothetical protein